MQRLPGWLRLLAALVLFMVTTPSALARGGIESVWQPGYNQLEVFFIDDEGAVNVVWKGGDGYWHQPQRITPTKWGEPGTEVTALWQVQNDQLEVFWVDGAGALSAVAKHHNGDWFAPVKLSGPGFAVPGSPLAGFWQPVYHQLHVFGIAGDGSVNFVYKTENRRWSAAARMSGPRTAAPGSKPAALYQPTGEQSQLFFTSPNGSVMLTWKGKNGPWVAPVPITPPGVVADAGWLDVVHYAGRGYEQVEVFFTDPRGALNVVWKNRGDIYRWRTETITAPNFAPAGAPVSGVSYPASGQLEVFGLGSDGGMKVAWKQNNGGWKQVESTTAPAASAARNTVSAVVLPNPLQLEVFYQDAQGALWVSWKQANGNWEAPHQLTKARGQTKVDREYCNAYWRDWYAGLGPATLNMVNDCAPFAPGACRWWHMSNPGTYITNDDNQILILMHSRVRDKAFPDTFREAVDENGINIFGGKILAHSGYLGNPEGQLHGKITAGRFNTRTGRIGFEVRLWLKRDGDGSIPVARYGGQVSELIADPFGGGKGTVYAPIRGSYFRVNGTGGGTWISPYPGKAPIVFCNREDLTFLPLPEAAAPAAPKPIKVTGRPRDPMPTQPAPAANVSFSGDWVTKVQNGVIYNMKLVQDTTGRVSGDYVFGKISDGLVVGRQLFAVWTQGKATGTVMFQLAPDGTSFAGMWQQGDTKVKPTERNAKGSWDGYSSNVFTRGRQVGNFEGTYALSKLIGQSTPLTFTLSGDRVSGSYLNGAISGTVKSYPGRPTELTVQLKDGLTSGSGTFFLYPDGSGFSGYWHSSFAGLNAWSGSLTAPPPAQVAVAPPPPAVTPPPVVVTPPPPPVVAAPVVPVTPPPVVVLPQGQCPAATAVVSQQLNIREGRGADSKGGPVVGRVEGGTRVQCVACDSGWCQIAASNPNATVSRRYLEFELPQVAVVTPPPPPLPPAEPVQPPPPPPPPVEEAKVEPQKPANADFSGEWSVRTSTGIIYQFRIQQNAAGGAGGGFSDQFGNGGQFSAQVAGDTLTLQWFNNQGYQGVGNFKMKADGKSFAGAFNGYPQSPLGDRFPVYRVPGTWESFIPAPPAPDDRIDYGGCAACGPAKPENPR